MSAGLAEVSAWREGRLKWRPDPRASENYILGALLGEKGDMIAFVMQRQDGRYGWTAWMPGDKVKSGQADTRKAAIQAAESALAGGWA